MSFRVTDVSQCLIRIFNDRRTFIRSYRRDLLTHIGNLIRIGYNNLFCFFASEIRKLLQHFFCRAQIQWCLIVRIFKTFSCHNDPAVHFVLRIKEMHITGCHDRLFKFLSQFYDPTVDIFDVIPGLYRFFLAAKHKFIVSQGLNLQIIIKFHDPGNLFIRLTAKQRPV